MGTRKLEVAFLKRNVAGAAAYMHVSSSYAILAVGGDVQAIKALRLGLPGKRGPGWFPKGWIVCQTVCYLRANTMFPPSSSTAHNAWHVPCAL